MSDTSWAVAVQFAECFAAKDRDGMVALLADPIDFRGLTPGRFWEAASAAELVDDVILGHWLEPHDVVEALESVETGEVADRTRLAYRLRVRNHDGLHLLEQQAYLMVDDGRIGFLRVMCSGFRPLND